MVMKIRNLFFIGLAVAALFTSCEENEDNLTGTPKIELSTATLSFNEAEGTQTVTLTTNRDWVVDVPSSADWLTVTPTSGSASDEPQTITVEVEANTEYQRSAEIVFDISVMQEQLTVSQGGKTIEYTNIADVRAMSATPGEMTDIQGAVFIKGIVVSNQQELDNLTSNKSVYIQDETAGIQLYFAQDITYARGDSISINLTGLKISYYGDAMQIVEDTVEGSDGKTQTVGVPNDAATLLASGNTIVAKEITMEEFRTFAYEGQYVAITTPVQVSDADKGKTFVVGNEHTSIMFTDATGSGFEVRTSSYSDILKETAVPEGSGVIKGIASRYYETPQIIFSTTDDWTGLTGERFEVTLPEVQTVTVAEFLSKSVSDNQYYQLTGKVTDLYNTEYGNFHLVDETGDVLVYGLTKTQLDYNDKSFSQIGLKEGDIVTLIGTRDEYGGEAQVGGPAYYVSHEEGTGEPVEPGEIKTVTIAQFLEASVSSSQPYQLTGQMSQLESGNYGNFWLTDETGTVYVYGLKKSEDAGNQTFPELGLKNGYYVTLVGYRTEYKGSPQVGNAYYISHEEGELPEEPEATAPFTSTIEWTLGEKAYDQTSDKQKQTGTVNGTPVNEMVKLGTSDESGSVIFHIPAGTAKLGFYAVAWKGASSTLTFSGADISPVTVRGNQGATGNPPYANINVTGSDFYEIEVNAATDLDLTVEGSTRVIFWGINPVE